MNKPSGIEETRSLADSDIPALVVVDADEEGLSETVSALRRRFGSDYRVLGADSAPAGLDARAELAERGEAVTLPPDPDLDQDPRVGDEPADVTDLLGTGVVAGGRGVT